MRRRQFCAVLGALALTACGAPVSSPVLVPAAASAGGCGCGVAPPVPTGYDPLSYADTGAVAPTPNYLLVSAFARLVLHTSSPVVAVAAYSDIYGDYPQYAGIGVRVDGADRPMLACTRVGANQWLVALPPGAHTVELITGLTSRIDGVIRGTWLTGVGTADGATPLHPASAVDRVLVYGDSISVGDGAAQPPTEAWTARLRASRSASVAVEGYGRRTLRDDDPVTLAAALAAYAPQTVWLAIGTNDYGLAAWPAASFGVGYGALLDALHARLPVATIVAQTPLWRAQGGPNAHGDDIAAYRAAIAQAAATRPWVTLVDGGALLGAGDLGPDGLHPSTAGHARYAALALDRLSAI